MGSAVAGLAFMPPTRSSEELSKLMLDDRLVLMTDPHCGTTVAGLHFDCGSSTTLLHSHANAEDLLDVKEFLATLSHRLNMNVLGYDYHGYGLSRGSHSEEACHFALRTCFNYLADKGVARNKIILMGRSLGTGPTLSVAAEEADVAGVVLQSPVLSILRTRFSEKLLDAMQLTDSFMNEEKIKKVSCPVFIMHGSQDSIVHPEHGEQLSRLAPNAVRPFWADGCGHNDVSSHPEYFPKLNEFCQFLAARGRRQWQEVAAAYSKSMVVRPKISQKILMTAL